MSVRMGHSDVNLIIEALQRGERDESLRNMFHQALLHLHGIMTDDQRNIFGYTSMYLRHHAASLVHTPENPINVDGRDDDSQSEISEHPSMPDLEPQSRASSSGPSSPLYQLADMIEVDDAPVEGAGNWIPSDPRRRGDYPRTSWPILSDSGSVFFHMMRGA